MGVASEISRRHNLDKKLPDLLDFTIVLLVFLQCSPSFRYRSYAAVPPVMVPINPNNKQHAVKP